MADEDVGAQKFWYVHVYCKGRYVGSRRFTHQRAAEMDARARNRRSKTYGLEAFSDQVKGRWPELGSGETWDLTPEDAPVRELSPGAREKIFQARVAAADRYYATRTTGFYDAYVAADQELCGGGR